MVCFLCAQLLAISTGIRQISLPWFCFDQQIYTHKHTNSTGKEKKAIWLYVRACEFFLSISLTFRSCVFGFLRNRLKYLLNTMWWDCDRKASEKSHQVNRTTNLLLFGPNKCASACSTLSLSRSLSHTLPLPLALFPFGHSFEQKISKKNHLMQQQNCVFAE